MSCNKQDIVKQQNEEDNYANPLEDSDVDEITEEMKLICDVESDEYSDDDDAILQTNQMLQSLTHTNSSFTVHEKELKELREEESEEYSEDENIYPSRITTMEAENAEKNEEKWTFVTPGTDYRPICLPKFSEPSGPTFSLPTSPTPSDFYKKMLPDSLFNLVTECTNLRARQHFDNVITQNNKSWCDVSSNEMKKFFAMCIHMGMIRKRRIQDYWSTNPLLVTPIFHSRNYLSRDRFLQILRFLRFADYGKMIDSDRLKKLRPFLNMTQNLCISMYTPRRSVAVDETLLLYKGRISFKQYNPRKRARFGIKTIALCDSINGYLHNFEVYTGQGTNSWAENFPDAQKLPVSERIVVHLVGHILNKNYCIYADNWFTSVRLARWMTKHGTTLTGTIKKIEVICLYSFLLA
ncbi:unnamed protein product [Rotaria magnacalcarata]|uniref:PiggyBac transposable element-derived protein domain-containing protein n=3 Tax=Rotaria magnacalcarata TaxID=392030 RepID=A0A815HBU4_9BILA|nr:unnamed protein product [Rotaria magnacalcarata]CAF4286041.1 unnamed protein product [Rotaria magnacalcarata]